MIPIVQQVAKEYKLQLQNLYGNQLIELILFGSYARGDFNTESDIDFAVVLSNPDIYPAAEILKITPLSLQLELKYGLMLSTLPVSWKKKQAAMQGVYQNIRKEGIVI
jgi:predicted nucleotidyltransferase